MDGANKYGINNGNSIGIEICINSDGDYNKALSMTAELVADLMAIYSISLENVVRHYDASRKNCPQTMNNNGDWSKWIQFKSQIKNIIDSKLVKEVVYMLFKDEAQISPWALPSVKRLKELGIVKGDNEGNFNGKSPATKEQVVVLIDKVLQLLGK